MQNFTFFLFFLSCSLFAQENKSPKNIILLIGDGMGLNYVSSSVLSLKNDPYKNFTSVGLSITCAADKLITDSAAGATAIATGYRTNYYYVSVDKDDDSLLTIFEHAENLNISTGVVVTSTITHATPAAFLAHVNNRKNEEKIAKQFMEINVDVVIGGGSDFFTTKSNGGKQEEEFNLIEKIKSNGYNYYEDADDLFNYPPDQKFYALLEKEGLEPASMRNYTLGELTQTALKYLSSKNEGFILMVEGSQIDWAAHDNMTERTLSELYDFNTAINRAINFAEKDGNTLIVVTADHETGGMAITGGTSEGDSLKFSYTTGGHSAEMVGVFAKGPGEELFRGVYDNYMIGRKLFNLIDKNYKFSNN